MAQSCPTICNPVDYTVHGNLQDRILEWIAIPLPHCRRILYQASHQGRVFKILYNCTHLARVLLHASKTVLQARLQKYINHECPDGQAGFRKGRGQISNICWIKEKAREFQKNIYFCFVDYVKAFDGVDHNKFWKILKEMGISDHLTCLL